GRGQGRVRFRALPSPAIARVQSTPDHPTPYPATESSPLPPQPANELIARILPPTAAHRPTHIAAHSPAALGSSGRHRPPSLTYRADTAALPSRRRTRNPTICHIPQGCEATAPPA